MNSQIPTKIDFFFLKKVFLILILKKYEFSSKSVKSGKLVVECAKKYYFLEISFSLT